MPQTRSGKYAPACLESLIWKIKWLGVGRGHIPPWGWGGGERPGRGRGRKEGYKGRSPGGREPGGPWRMSPGRSDRFPVVVVVVVGPCDLALFLSGLQGGRTCPLV